MSNDGKEYSILQLLYAGSFFNDMGNQKKKKWEIKRRRNLRKLSQLHAFPFFKYKFEKFGIYFLGLMVGL